VFALKGMPEIYLEKKSSTPYSQLVLGEANGKILFLLTTNIAEISDTESEVLLKTLKNLAYNEVFDAKAIVKMEVTANNIINYLIYPRYH